MVEPGKRAPEKRLLYQDGRQATCRLGLVDPTGCMVNMLDSNGVVHLKFATNGEMVMDAEAAQRRAEAELALARAELAAVRESHAHLTALCRDMLEDGKFTRGMKSPFRSRYDRWRAR